jgi:hypothetical protein
MNLTGQNHLIECQCILSQFKDIEPPLFHHFIVFSVLENNKVKESYAQCNNCNIIHKIIDICKSEILKKDEMSTLNTIDELRYGIPDKLAEELNRLDCPIHIWQNVNFIYQNEMWKTGIQNVVVSTESVEDGKIGKYISIRNADKFFFNKFTRKETIEL